MGADSTVGVFLKNDINYNNLCVLVSQQLS